MTPSEKFLNKIGLKDPGNNGRIKSYKQRIKGKQPPWIL